MAGSEVSPARRRLSGKRAFFEQLLADGVGCIFGNPGTTEQGIIDLLPDYPSISYYLALHESVAVGMADFYARATRKPALVQLHIAPGLGNGIGMLYNAMKGRSPLVVYVGQSSSRALFQEPYLSGDLVSLACPVTKWAAEISQTADIPQALSRAFKVAEEPPQGPVMLSIPMDALDDEADLLIRPTSYVRWASPPPRGAVREAVSMLLGAKAPAIAVGDHVALSDGQAAVVALAELLGAPILNAFSNGVNAPAGHPLYQPRGIPISSRPLRKALEPHDLLLAVGTSLFPSILPEPEGPIPETTRVIHVDYDSWELGKNHGGGLLLRADPKETLLALREEVLSRSSAALRKEWARRRKGIEASNEERREKLRDQHRRQWDGVPIAPPRLMAELADALPSEAVVVDEALTSGASLEMYLRPSEPWRRFRVRGGGIGGGMPGALGAQVAFPDRPVVGVVSDGSSLYTIAALWTAAHHRLPVKYVICNNRSYRILKQNLQEYRLPEEASRPFVHMDLTDPDLGFVKLAEGFGVPAQQIERPEQIGPALKKALETDGPMLLDVVLDGTP